jgi:hypothetical protein
MFQSPGATLVAFCDPSAPGTGSALFIQADASAASDQAAVWWNQSGVDGQTSLAPGTSRYVTPDGGYTTPFMVVLQVTYGSTVSTFTVSEWYDSATDTCSFAGQVVTVSG